MDHERFLVELGYTRHPSDIIELLRKSQPVTLKYLDGQKTCHNFTEGNLLGKGKSGMVYDLKEQDNKGITVVIKEFTAKEAPLYITNNHDNNEHKNTHTKGLYVLSSSLNDIVMSSIFHSFYAGTNNYSITFPYFEGFFVCGDTGYAVIEKLEMTLSKFIDTEHMTAKRFRILMFQVLFSLKFLNKEEVMHNDVHAKNIMVRYTKGISYKGQDLEHVKSFSYQDGSKEYFHSNVGVIAKIVDFDFAAKFGEPSIVAEKVYKRRDDNWNINFRFAKTYDLLTFVAYMIYYTIIQTPNISRSELNVIHRIMDSICDFIVKRTEETVGNIKYRKHLKKDSDYAKLGVYSTYNETENNRTSVSKVMDMVSIPEYRPYEKYCHLDVDDILDIEAFESFRKFRSGSFSVGSM